jgi:Domain of unknown function (DUF4279)
VKTQKESSGRWSAASLRIFSAVLTHQEITIRLGLAPTRAHIKGDLVNPRHTTTWREHAWLLASPLGKDKDLATHLRSILDLTWPKKDTVTALTQCCRIDLFCGYASIHGQGGFTLDHEILARVADMRLSLDLDLYPPLSVGIQGGGRNQLSRRVECVGCAVPSLRDSVVFFASIHSTDVLG